MKMEAAKLIVDLIGKLIWPIIVIIIVWKFRKQISSIRFNDINEFELPGGIKAKISQEIKAVIEEATDDLDSPIIKDQTEIAQKNEIDFERSEAGSNTLLAFTANTTKNENLKYNIYYDPVGRNHNIPFKYIGLYAQKSIFAIGEVKKVVSCDYINGKLVETNGDDLSKLNDDEYDRIKNIIENTPYYDIKRGVKFFLVDRFYKTNYIKSSDYPIGAKKYIWLDEVNGFKNDMTTAQIAQLLDKKEWE